MIRGLIRRIAVGMALIAGALLVLVVAITMVNVAGFSLNMAARPFGATVPGLPGYEDAVSFFIGVAALFFMPYCQLTRGHVSVDLFTDMLSPAWRGRLARLNDALMAAAAAFFAVMMSRGMISYLEDGVRSPVLDWPVWPFLAPGVLALAMWSLTAALMAVSPAIAAPDAGAEAAS